jgi:CBS domain-containing protein
MLMSPGTLILDCAEDWMTKNPAMISPDATVKDTTILMAEKKIGSMLVKTEDKKSLFKKQKGKLIGILTDTDIIRKVIANGLDPKTIKIEQVMSTKLITVGRSYPMLLVAKEMLEHRIKRLPVLDKEEIVGIITITDLMFALLKLGKLNDLHDFIKKNANKEISDQVPDDFIKIKNWMSTTIVAIRKENTVLEAAQLMNLHKFGALPIIDETGFLEGIITDTDIVRNVAKSEFRPSDVRVGQIMTTALKVADPDNSMITIVELIAKHGFKRIPIVQNKKLVGLISSTDVINVLSQLNLYNSESHRIIEMMYKGTG